MFESVLLKFEKLWSPPNENQAMDCPILDYVIWVWVFLGEEGYVGDGREGEEAPGRGTICPSWYNSQKVEILLKVKVRRMGLKSIYLLLDSSIMMVFYLLRQKRQVIILKIPEEEAQLAQHSNFSLEWYNEGAFLGPVPDEAFGLEPKAMFKGNTWL